MAEKNKNKIDTIPQSVLIADVRGRLNEIAQCPMLPLPILELIFKEAWQSVAFRAQNQLMSDYQSYNEQRINDEKTEVKENGI